MNFKSIIVYRIPVIKWRIITRVGNKYSVIDFLKKNVIIFTERKSQKSMILFEM